MPGIVPLACIPLASVSMSSLGCVIDDRFFPAPPHPELKWKDCASVQDGRRIAQIIKTAPLAITACWKDPMHHVYIMVECLVV